MYRDLNDYEMVYLVRDNDQEFDMLYNKYLPLINKISNKYYKYFKKFLVDKEDLIQILSIAFIRAINNFNDYFNSTFYNYLVKVLENEIKVELKRINNLHNRIYTNTIYDEVIINNIVDKNIDHLNNMIIKEYYLNYKYSLNNLDSYIFDLKFEGFTAIEICNLLEIDYNYCIYKIKCFKSDILYI